MIWEPRLHPEPHVGENKADIHPLRQSRRIKNYVWQIRDREIILSKRMLIMGILNVTPDSFYDGGKYFQTDLALKKALSLVKAGADIIDIGGQSSRPYAQEISLAEERKRVIPIVRVLSSQLDVPISIDTYRYEIAQEAISEGAHMINDISALRMDPKIAVLANSTGAGLILMHMRGMPRDMQDDTHYDDLVSEIIQYLSDQMQIAIKEGVRTEQIVLDPGLGFGKNVEQNCIIVSNSEALFKLHRPILLGPSRKSFIGHITDKAPEERLPGTLACVARAYEAGVHIIRVHDVEETKSFLKMLDAFEVSV